MNTLPDFTVAVGVSIIDVDVERECTGASLAFLLLIRDKTVEDRGVKLLALARVKHHVVNSNLAYAGHWCVAEKFP